LCSSCFPRRKRGSKQHSTGQEHLQVSTQMSIEPICRPRRAGGEAMALPAAACRTNILFASWRQWYRLTLARDAGRCEGLTRRRCCGTVYGGTALQTTLRSLIAREAAMETTRVISFDQPKYLTNNDVAARDPTSSFPASPQTQVGHRGGHRESKVHLDACSIAWLRPPTQQNTAFYVRIYLGTHRTNVYSSARNLCTK
jgi:hypothetical protein